VLPRLAFPDHDLAALYDGDIIRLTLPTGPVDLLPTMKKTSAPPGKPRYVAGLWNPFGRPTSLAVNEQYAALAADTDGGSLRGEAGTYAEAASVVASRARAQTIARRHGQPALLRWSAEGVAVLASDTFAVVAQWPVELRPVPARSCLLGESGSEPCRPRGGGWTSGAISAALVWQHDLATWRSAMGDCSLCNGDRGGAIGLVELSVRSRWERQVFVVGPR
jgi:hypothetical protein